MSKMFYSLEEVQQKLGISAEQIKGLVQEGRLREFRDGAKLMFKTTEVESLGLAQPGGAGASSGGDSEIGLVPLDEAGRSAAPLTEGPDQSGPALGADGAGSIPDGSEIGLAPMETGTQTGMTAGITAGGSGDHLSLDDSSPGAEKDDTVITDHGVNVLGDSDEAMEMIDPMAQTELAPDLADQVDLDSGSSGSGLLDLTREADDTSLGAELLDEIYPGAEEGGGESQGPTLLDQEVALQPAGGDTVGALKVRPVWRRPWRWRRK